jgi:hypothetical protein
MGRMPCEYDLTDQSEESVGQRTATIPGILQETRRETQNTYLPANSDLRVPAPKL